MTAPTSTTNASDPWEMALIHRLIRRGFEQAREVVLVPVRRPRRRVAEYVRFHLDGLQAHHSSEDELIWPVLHERASMSDALIRRMEEQHAGLHDALETTRRELAAWERRTHREQVRSARDGPRAPWSTGWPSTSPRRSATSCR